MKIHFKYTAWVLSILLCGCFGDKDSIATLEFDHVLSVKGVLADEDDIISSHNLYLGDTISLVPEISLSSGSISDYSFRWLLGKDTIAREKNLHWQVALPRNHKLGESIPAVFILRNKNNGLEFREPFRMTIQNNVTPSYIAVYETLENGVEWISIQGNMSGFTRFFPGMNELINGKEQPIAGRFRGAMVATDEVLLFTDQPPGFGCSISLSSGKDYLPFEIGEKIDDIKGRVYQGKQTDIVFRDVRYCVGGTRYILMNDALHTFQGNNKRLPIYDDETFLKARSVVQVLGSKQFAQTKKGLIYRTSDNRLYSFHEFNRDAYPITGPEGEIFTLDTVYGMFASHNALAMRQPYEMYIIGKKGQEINLYEFKLTYNTGITDFNAPVWSKTIPIPDAYSSIAREWYGSYGQRYGFFTTRNAIYKFDYLNITDFNPDPTPIATFGSRYEILNVFPQLTGSGRNEQDDGTVVFLYDASLKTTSIHLIETVTGKVLAEYPNVIPGKGKDFFKR